MIIYACPIFFRNSKCNNLALLKNNNTVITRMSFLQAYSYTFLKSSNLCGKNHLVFENLGIKGTSINARSFRHQLKVSTL